MQISESIKFYQSTAALTHLQLLSSTRAELSGCNRDQMPIKLKICTLWPFSE